MLSSASLALRRSARSFVRPTPSLLRQLTTAPSPTLHPSQSGLKPPHLLTLADLSVPEIQSLITSAINFKKYYKDKTIPAAGRIKELGPTEVGEEYGVKSLEDKTVALMFSKRSTRTRVASETAIKLLGES